MVARHSKMAAMAICTTACNACRTVDNMASSSGEDGGGLLCAQFTRRARTFVGDACWVGGLFFLMIHRDLLIR